MAPPAKPIVADWDDLSDQTRDRLEWVAKLSDHYPNFVGTLFAIPALCSNGTIREALGIKGVRLAVHGWRHGFGEAMAWTADQTVGALKMAAHRGITEPVFRAPNWLINGEVYQGCQQAGYIVADHTEFRCTPPKELKDEWPRRVYTYNRQLRNPAVTRVHGHVQNVTSNGLEETWAELTSFPRDSQFLSIPDAIERFAGRKPVGI